MKKNLLNITLLLVLACFSKAYGQTIPNPNFDSWTAIPYNKLDNWGNSNAESIRKNGSITTTSVTGSTGKGVRMQTNILNSDTVFGYIINSLDPNSDPTMGQGGSPYSQKPTNIIGQFRYNLPGNDTAIILVIFKKNGVIISNNFMKIRGTGNQSTFTAFSYSLAVASSTTTPDSVIIAFASSNAITNVGIQNNSFLEVDEISFTGPGITQAIVNGSFENWTPSVYNKLNNWGVFGEGVSQVAPGQSGAYALELQTLLYPGNFIGQSRISNGTFPPQGGYPKGGQPYTQTLDTLFGYYKFSGSTDSAVISIELKKLGSTVSGAMKYLKNQANWTLFKLPIFSGTAPDTMSLTIFSSVNYGLTSAGSKLSIDNLYLKSQPTALIKLSGNTNKLTFFPNPSKYVINLRLGNGFTGVFKIYDINGGLVKLNNISNSDTELTFNIENLSNGLYFVHIENSNGTMIEKFIKE